MLDSVDIASLGEILGKAYRYITADPSVYDDKAPYGLATIEHRVHEPAT